MRVGTWTVVAAVLGQAAALYAFGLAGPPVPAPGYIHDECYQAFTAHRYAIGDPDAWRWGERDVLERMGTEDLTSATTYEWVHPPLAKLMMSAFIRVFGFTSTVFRAPSVLCGLFTIVLTLLLGRRLYGGRAGVFAGVLLLFDGMLFVFSRVAMNDIYVTAMVIAVVAATYRTWVAASPGTRRGWALTAGAASAAAIATKWNSAPTLIVSGVAVFIVLWRHERRPLAIAVWALAFLVIPATVYVACYAPYLRQGHGLAELWKLQVEIWDFHRSLRAGHSSSSRWYEWPLMIRPVWFYQGDGPVEGTLREIYGFGNPLLWWLMFPAIAGLTVHAWRARSVADAFVVVPFLVTWLPWAVIGRVTFIQYVLPALPFGVLAIVRVASMLIEPRWLRRVAPAYAIAVALFFVHVYPLLTGRPVTTTALQSPRWFWFPAWRPCSGDCDAPSSGGGGEDAADDAVDTASTADDLDDLDALPVGEVDTASDGVSGDEIVLP